MIIPVTVLLETERLFGITVPAGRSRSVKNVADTKLFASLKLAKSKYRRFSRPASTAMHKKASQQAGGSVLLPFRDVPGIPVRDFIAKKARRDYNFIRMIDTERQIGGTTFCRYRNLMLYMSLKFSRKETIYEDCINNRRK